MSEKLKPLLAQIASGDAMAFRKIFDQFSGKVYLFTLKLTRSQSTAEEVVQETFTRIWVNREALPDIEYFPSYLYTITRNLTFNILKRMAIEEKAKSAYTLRQSLSDNNTEQVIFCNDYEHILHKIIDRLPPQQKLVYGLCHGEGLKYEEAAERLNISRLTVKTHMQHALKTIKTHFGGFIGSFFIGSLLS
jgi:RNA polymerase sigma-70 factor (family 1)